MSNFKFFRNNLDKKVKKQNLYSMTSNIFLSVFHIRTMVEAVITAVTLFLFSIFAHYQTMFQEHNSMFIAIWSVVWLDWGFGVWLAIRNSKFETRKALKVLYYSVAYTSMLVVVLEVKKGFPSAFWMSDGIIMPILIFQTISILKNMSLLKIIPQGLFLEILKKIDNYKEINLDITDKNETV